MNTQQERGRDGQPVWYRQLAQLRPNGFASFGKATSAAGWRSFEIWKYHERYEGRRRLQVRTRLLADSVFYRSATFHHFVVVPIPGIFGQTETIQSGLFNRSISFSIGNRREGRQNRLFDHVKNCVCLEKRERALCPLFCQNEPDVRMYVLRRGINGTLRTCFRF